MKSIIGLSALIVLAPLWVPMLACIIAWHTADNIHDEYSFWIRLKSDEARDTHMRATKRDASWPSDWAHWLKEKRKELEK